jgi:hypothetical protein
VLEQDARTARKTDTKTIHHRGTEFYTLLTAPQAQLTIRNAFLCASVVKYFLVFDCQAVNRLQML